LPRQKNCNFSVAAVIEMPVWFSPASTNVGLIKKNWEFSWIEKTLTSVYLGLSLEADWKGAHTEA
jgi:hypothetical protein